MHDEITRIGHEGVVFIKSPVEPYSAESIIFTGAFLLSYLADQGIKADLVKVRSKSLDKAADLGSQVGNPYIHIGIATILYGTGVVSDVPRFNFFIF